MATKTIGGITIPSNTGYTGSGWNYNGQTYSPLPAAAKGVTGGTTASPIAAAIASGGGADTSGGGGGGGSFDFNTDPGYLAALAAQQAGAAQADAALRAARESALVNFGDPSLAGAFGIDDLSPLTAAMAQQATTSGVSTLAQLQRQRDQGQQNIVNSLAAHGLIRSGDLGWRTGQNQQDYGTALYNAQQGVLNSLAESARNTALQKQGLATNTVSALTGAYNTYVANPDYYGMAGGTKAATPAATPATPAAPAPVSVPKTTTPVSRLATPAPAPVLSPYRFQVAKNVRAG